MTAPQLALLSFMAGASAALGVMAAIAIRSVCTITRGHRWYQIKQL